MYSTFKASLAEFVGTFLFVLVGATVSLLALMNQVAPGVDPGILGVALVHGLAIAVLISTFGHVSGGHFNPAVSFGLAAAGRLRASRALSYVVAQVAGSIAAAFVVARIFEGVIDAIREQGPQAVDFVNSLALGANRSGPLGLSVGTGILVEAVFTFFLVLVVWGTCVERRSATTAQGFAVGLTVTVGILCAASFSGAAFNPARHIGPALVSGNLGDWWVYWIGPFLGSAAASLLWTGAFSSDLEEETYDDDDYSMVDSWDAEPPAHAMLPDVDSAAIDDSVQSGAMIGEGGPATAPPSAAAAPPSAGASDPVERDTDPPATHAMLSDDSGDDDDPAT